MKEKPTLDRNFLKNKQLLLLLFSVLQYYCSSNLFAQDVSSYNFTTIQNNYTELINPNIIVEATSQSGSGAVDDQVYELEAGTIPFNFSFNGTSYNRLNINANGFVTFGNNITGNTQPISSAIAYDGVIAPFSGADLIALFNVEGLTGSITYKVMGNAPNREFVIQWKNFTLYNSIGYTNNRYVLNFQTRLHENGTIKFVYDASVVGNPSSMSVRVGLRGNNNTQFNNRSAEGTNSWSSTQQGNSNTSGIQTNSNNIPTSGLTFFWTLPEACIAPTEQPTNLQLTKSGIIINGTYTPANSSVDRYLILRHVEGQTPNNPVNGTTYPVGQNENLNAYVIYYGSNTSFESNYNTGDVRGNNAYIYTIYSVNSNCTGGPLYLVDNPLTNTITNCPLPINDITVTNKTTTSFTLNWPIGENGNALPLERVFEISTDENFTNLINGAPFILNATDITLNITGLNPNTQYYYRAKNSTSLCESSYSTSKSIFTACVPNNSFEENFDNVETVNYTLQLPNCWSIITVGTSSSTPTVNITPTYHNSAPNGITFYGNGADMSDLNNKAILVSPQLTNIAAGTHRLRFRAKMSSSGGTYDLQVVALSSNSADATIEIIETITSAQLSTNYEEFTVNFSNYSGSANYIGIRRINGSSYSYLCVDDIIWEVIPSCPDVYELSVSETTNNSTVLSWSGIGTSYDIEYVNNNVNFSGTPTVTNVSNHYLLDGSLDPNTNYKFQVRQNCTEDNNGVGVWSSEFEFKTNCNPVTEEFTEIFESTTNNTTPSCWSFIKGGSGSGFVDSITGNANSGSKYFYITNSTDASGNYILVSPLTDNFGNGTFRVKFYAKSSTLGQSLVFGTLSDPNDASSFTALENIALTTTYQEYSFNLTGDNSYFGFKHGLGATYRTIYIDDVVYELQPPCPDVSGLSAGALSDSAILSWNGLGDAYDVEYVENTESFTGTASFSEVQNNYSITGLTPQTTYKFRVRQNCTDNDYAFGVWSSPVEFTTACEIISSFPFEEDFETTSNYTNCWSNEYVLGTASWTYEQGSTSTINTAQSGSRNARFVSSNGTSSPITKLVSPIFDLSVIDSPKLSFYYAQPNWNNDVNELKVYYRTSPSSIWIELAHFENAKNEWTQEIFDLPEYSTTYQIAFEGINNYGRANIIDMVRIYEDDLSCMPTFEYNSDSNMITHVILNTIDKTSPFVSGTTPVYEDFTEISTDLQQGNTYPISVKGPSSTFPSDVMVYIDFNQNNDFSDDGEGFYIGRINPANPANAHTITSNILIPNDALTGATKMRIIKNTNALALSNPDAENSISGPCAGDLRSGQVEEYSLNITQTANSICDGTEPGENIGDTGCISFTYNGETVNYTTVRGADGNIWLQQNMGSNAVATSATDEIGFGDLFQWGRWDDGHQKRNSETSTTLLSSNNPLGLNGGSEYFYVTDPEWWKNGNTSDTWEATTPQDVSESNGCDPCKAMGEGWRLPTEQEWEEIINAEQITNIQTAFDSSLKLTVAGARGSSGIYNDGVRGYYWSKSPSENPDFTKYLYYSNFIINPSAGGFREQGSSVRCLKISESQTDSIVVEIATQNNTEPLITTENGTLQLIATVNPNEANQAVTWSITEGEELATVAQNGLVTAVANGTVTIRATSVEDTSKFDEIEVVINYSATVIVENVEISVENDLEPEITTENGTLQLIATVNPNEVNQAVTWSVTQGGELATINQNGLVTAVANGSVTVRATSVGDTSKFDEIEVVINYSTTVIVENVEISVEDDLEPEITAENGTLQLIATVNPNEVNQAVTWSITEGEESATVDQNGLVTAIANGTITVRATSIEDTTKFDELEIIIDINLSNDTFKMSEFVVYPNPTSNFIEILSELEIDEVQIFDMTGKKLMTSNSKRIDISSFTSGNYILQIQFKNNITRQIKVIKR